MLTTVSHTQGFLALFRAVFTAGLIPGLTPPNVASICSTFDFFKFFFFLVFLPRISQITTAVYTDHIVIYVVSSEVLMQTEKEVLILILY